MLVQSFITNSVYRGINQRLPSYLMWPAGVLNAVNFALNDIQTFEWRYWTWMYYSEEFDCTPYNTQTDVTVSFQTTYPILRIIRIDDMSDSRLDNYELRATEPFNIQGNTNINLESNEFRYQMHQTDIKLYNNRGKYRVHYLRAYPMLGMTDTIPIPDLFLWVLYNLTLEYIYPQYGQLGENRETNVYNKARQQLTDLAKVDSFQITWVHGNIH